MQDNAPPRYARRRTSVNENPWQRKYSIQFNTRQESICISDEQRLLVNDGERF